MIEHIEQNINALSRIQRFAVFFKNYMSVWAVIAAALPIPITSMKLIPTYSAQTPVLSTYTSLFCFLLLGFIFYSRHALARLMFKSAVTGDHLSRIASLVRMAPMLLIVASLSMVFLYHWTLDNSIKTALKENNKVVIVNIVRELEKNPGYLDAENKITWGRLNEMEKVEPNYQSLMNKIPVSMLKLEDFYDGDLILKTWPRHRIPNGLLLMALYFGIFIFAECAFILMAIKEYMQDVLKLTENDLIAIQTANLPSQ